MADVPAKPPEQAAETTKASASNTVVVKKYANRRLYNTETSSYITLDNLAEMIRAGRDFVVYDAKSGDDITRGVLTQIIVEEESKGSAMLPVAFLRQLIGFYGGNLEGVVPRYLEYSMSSFARQQQQMRTVMERTFSPFIPAGVEEMNRQNLAMFDRAVSMWNPFARAGDAGHDPSAAAPEHAPEQMPEASGAAEGVAEGGAEASDENPELAWLRNEVASLQRQLAAAHAAAVVPAPVLAASVIPENVRRDPVAAGGNGKVARRTGPKASA
ncbi:MAG: polyhydroxyalkanoate synthesis repressor PhaR [Janthinobacterium lividum]